MPTPEKEPEESFQDDFDDEVQIDEDIKIDDQQEEEYQQYRDGEEIYDEDDLPVLFTAFDKQYFLNFEIQKSSTKIISEIFFKNFCYYSIF